MAFATALLWAIVCGLLLGTFSLLAISDAGHVWRGSRSGHRRKRERCSWILCGSDFLVYCAGRSVATTRWLRRGSWLALAQGWFLKRPCLRLRTRKLE